MTDGVEAGYLLLVEWDDRFVRPGVVARHHLACPEGMPEADFEKLIVDTVLPRLAKVSTRIGGVARASLLKADATLTGGFLNLGTELPTGSRDEVRGFRLVGSLPAKSPS
jgi:hypothetical protein